ncbi:hypothetical protein C0584_02355 [Candidatus Parcubacteria bacterium]|nr:MAG: hypothetical protein C0584_02355 [Candidatus Parcubacteria bacterium]
MKKVILVVEDKEEEQILARKAVADSGHGIILCANLFDAKSMIGSYSSKLSGIVADLHFPERSQDTNLNKPAGLAILTLAVSENIPVVVCSDMDNHQSDYVKDVIRYLGKHTSYGGIPFSVDRKDWLQSVKQLNAIMAKGE